MGPSNLPISTLFATFPLNISSIYIIFISKFDTGVDENDLLLISHNIQ